MAQLQNGHTKKQLNIAVVGGGLVGSLEALYLAKRGHRVRLYEYREDIQKTPLARGRSINLALSLRGRTALKDVGLEDHMIQEHGIPMRARMIHRVDGSTYAIPYDARTNQCIYSVGRNYLNQLLLKESEKYENVVRHFNHKLVEANLRKGVLTFQKADKESIHVTADLIVGADGAFSAVRRAMMQQPLFDYSQRYIEHGYLELCIPADNNGGFQMPANYLHIWPRGNFMMIALPNQDCSWTVTLFMPFTNFKSIDSSDKLLEFFEKYFPDSISLIGMNKLIEDFYLKWNCMFQMPANYLHIWPRGNFMMIALPNQDCSWTVTLFMPFTNFKSIDSSDKLLEFFEKYFPDSISLIGMNKLIEDFFSGSPSALVAVKCRPYHVEDKALIIGDAAHAVVPFYGQGMNAGFEDCTLLDRLFQKYDDNLTKILEEFSETRWEDTHAICDLALYNYIEMRDLVTRPSYRIRKAVDDFIFWLLPDFWVPLYNSVTFTTMPYSQCVKNRKWQDKMLVYFFSFVASSAAFGYWLMSR